jgi:hypothetical protein
MAMGANRGNVVGLVLRGAFLQILMVLLSEARSRLAARD